MGDIKKRVSKNEIIMFFCACIKGFVNSEDKKKIIDVVYGNNSFMINHPGDLMSNSIYYHIFIDSQSGFAVLYKNVLKYFWLADSYGFIPVVEFSNNIKYACFNQNIQNPFELFFNQPTEIDVEMLKQIKNVIHSKPSDLKFFSENVSYDTTECEIEELARTHSKFLRIRDELLGEIESDAKKMFKNYNVLGVHVRGTDFRKNYKGHPVFIDAEEFLEKTIAEFYSGGYEKVFLATDENKTVELFRKEFKDNLICYECERSDNETAIHFHRNIEDERNYKIGVEVLRDIYTLAQCQSFIGGKSNVSMMTRIVNLSFYSKFKKCIVLDAGINMKGKTLVVRKKSRNLWGK